MFLYFLARSHFGESVPAMAQHDDGTPGVIYHVVQQPAWDAAQAAGDDAYFPPRYDKDGFIHATHEAAHAARSSVLSWQRQSSQQRPQRQRPHPSSGAHKDAAR